MKFLIGWLRVFGFGAGVAFDLGAFFKRLKKSSPSAAPAGSFVYVIRGDHGMNKIGVSTDPNTRISDLQTGSPFALKFEFIGATSGNGYDIESLAHEMLDRHRQEGEWFKVPPEMAVAAVHGAAHKLGYALTPVPQSEIDSVLRDMQVVANANGKPQLTTGGKIIAFTYIAIVAALISNYDGHFLSIFIVSMLIGVAIVKPLLLRRFLVRPKWQADARQTSSP